MSVHVPIRCIAANLPSSRHDHTQCLGSGDIDTSSLIFPIQQTTSGCGAIRDTRSVLVSGLTVERTLPPHTIRRLVLVPVRTGRQKQMDKWERAHHKKSDLSRAWYVLDTQRTKK